MRPLVNTLPSSDDVLFVFYDFETRQDSKLTDSATVLVPNLVCLQQFCAKCETEPVINKDLHVAGSENIHSSKILWGTCYFIFANLDLGAIKS
jgi:hypothetical protein